MRFQSFKDMRRAARKMPPTKGHRPAVWECMLGTVYAANAARKVEYFDFDYAAAATHVGDIEDVRVARAKYGVQVDADHAIRQGQWVWWVKDVPPAGGSHERD